MSVDISPQGDTRAIVGFPHVRNLLLVALQLQIVVAGTNVVLRAVHRHLERILDFLHGRLEIAHVHVRQVVRLTTVCINRCTRIAQCPNKVDELRSLPLEGVVVVVNQNGIWPALMCHLESLDNPVVARLSVATECSLVRSWRMTRHSFVHHVNQRQVGIVILHGIHPFHNGLVLLARGEVVHPIGILRTPDERVELEREIVTLGIVVGSVAAAPIEATTA